MCMHATTFQSRKRALRTPTVFTVSAMFRLGLLRSSDFSNRLIVSKRSDKSINRSCARIRVSRQSRRRVSRLCRVRVSRRSRLATALRAGTASLYINRGRYVHAILCPRPCVAAEPPRVATCPRAAAKPPCD